MTETLKDLAIRLEHFHTDQWAADEILNHEILTSSVVDPCTGTGILAESARRAGYRNVIAFDIHDWGNCPDTIDFLAPENTEMLGLLIKPGSTFFMNPPFSLACEFVQRCFELESRKVVMFQRFAFWESGGRKEFWDEYPPSRVYVCGDRANCKRHDIPVNDKGKWINPDTGEIMGGTTAAHAFFIFEKGQPPGTQLHRIYKN